MMLLLLTICFCAQSEQTTLIELIQEHQRSKKNFTVQDAYKLIYQSVFGVAHIVDNPAAAKKYLEHEFETVIASDELELLENISLSGEIIRLNLQPYKFQNGDTDQLFHAMLKSVEEISGNQKEFLKLWNEFRQNVLKGKLDFDKQELKIFDEEVKADNYPTRHHSSGYREANQPAYRVLKKDIAENLLTLQNITF